MDPVKVKAIVEWPTPSTVKDVQSFLGFANFYRRFIFGFSRLSAPLTGLTKKNVPWSWSEKEQQAFDALREKFTSDIILMHFDPEKKIIVETDASDYVSAGILSQFDDNRILRPVAFFSRKHSPAECNYEIYDKELLAVVTAFEEWRPELEGSKYPVDVLSDHKNLEWFMTTKQLSRRQARWSEFLSRFDFKIVCRPGKQGEKPDALTRRSGYLPSEEGDKRLPYQRQVVLKAHNLSPDKTPLQIHVIKKPLILAPVRGNDVVHPDPEDIPIETLWEEAYANDTFQRETLDLLRKGARKSKKIPLAECSERDEKLFFRDR